MSNNDNGTYRITLMIGHNVNNVPVLESDDIQDAIVTNCNICGATYIEAKGIWHGESENTTIAIIYTDKIEADRIREKIPQLAKSLKQESIYVDIQRTNAIEIHAC